MCMGEITNIVQTVYCNILFINSCLSPEKPEVPEAAQARYWGVLMGRMGKEKEAVRRLEQHSSSDGSEPHDQVLDEPTISNGQAEPSGLSKCASQ